MTLAHSKRRRSILVKGYYGFGNFGDDLLLVSVERIIRSRFPGARISIFSNFNERLPGFSQSPGYQNYIHRLVSGPIEIADWSTKDHFDLIVHGGGGVFFPPTNEGRVARPVGQAARYIGAPNFAALARFVRKVTARRRKQTSARSVAIGVGLGRYCDTSRRSLADLEILGGLDRIAVRDPRSLAIARRLGLGNRSASFTDLAFALDFQRSVGAPTGCRRVAFVMCAGKPFNEMMRAIMQQPGRWRPTPVMLDENHDRFLVDQMASDGLEPVVWRPNELSVEEFCGMLESFDLVVTNRAHGAVAAALIGIPTVVLNSDSKLRSIQAMLPHGTLLVGPKNAGDLVDAMDDAISQLHRLRVGLQHDVADQRSRIEGMSDFVFT